MPDEALTQWLADGAPVALSEERRLAEQRRNFVFRFIDAITPLEDKGVTEELHEAAVARDVLAIHLELNLLGEMEYDEVWKRMDAPSRAAIKAYIRLATR